MRNYIKHSTSLLAIIFLFVFYPNKNFSQTTCSKVTVTAQAEASKCRSSGKITITASGADLVNFEMSTAQYQILSVGQGYSTQLTANGGLFENVPPGTYTIVMKAFCKLATDWVVFSGQVSVKVDGLYIEPNMYVVTGEVRKTLNCKVTGMIPVAFYDGKAPYTATITSWPTGYSGDKVFTRATAGRLEIDNLPQGSYTLSLSDDCGTKLDDLLVPVGKVASDFPTGGTISSLSVYAAANNSTTDCKKFSAINLRFTPAITETHELYPYLKNANTYYDIYLSEENRPAESQGVLGATEITTGSPASINYLYVQNISLIDYTFKDLYPAGGKKGDLFLKVKGCPSTNTSGKVPFSLSKPYYSTIGTSKPTCDGFDLSVSQYSDYDGIICYPYIATVIKDNVTGVVVATKSITSSSSAFVTTVPWGTYVITFKGADGGEWWPSSATTPQKYTFAVNYFGTNSRYSYCREDGLTGFIRLYTSLNSAGNYTTFIPGTTIEVVEAPAGQVIPPKQTITSSNISDFYPYAVISGSSGNYSPIISGKHVFEIKTLCEGVDPIRITVNFPVQSNPYTNYKSSGYCKGASLGKFNSYMTTSDTYIPGGTIIKYKTGPDATAVKWGYPNGFVMPSGVSKYFCPFSSDYTTNDYTDPVTPGTYVFEVWDAACKSTYEVSFVVPEVYTADKLGYTVDHTSCSNMNIYPKGSLKLGGSNVTTYYRIRSAKNANGSVMANTDYDTRTISSATVGGYLSLYKNGTYLLEMTGSSVYSTTCFADTISVTYAQPVPTLVLAKTAAYVCNGESKGYIILKASGGYGGSGPYEYEIVGSNPLQRNQTGVFNYGAPNENLTIKVTDKSNKAIQLGCSPNFEQKITMLDLKDASIAYTAQDGKYCLGQTISLGCISLGDTKYNWEGPDNFNTIDQFPNIPNAQEKHTGWYYVTVDPENCGETKKDSVYINVNPLPSKPDVVTENLGLCYNSSSHIIANKAGATATTGNTLRWYAKDGVTVIASPTLNTNSYSNATDYYVSQINDLTGCESAKVKIAVSILVPPVAANILYHQDVCYNDYVNIVVSGSNPNYTYRLYSATSILYDTKTGTGGDLHFNPVQFTGTGTSLTYYVETMDPATGCVSSPRAARTVTRLASALAADIAARNDTICSGNTSTLQASASGIDNPVFRWYNGNSATSTLLGSGSTFTTPSLTSLTYYYVSVQGDGICENLPSARKQVSVRVLGYASSSLITATNQTICQGESATINITSTTLTNQAVFNWYTSQTETVPFFTGSSYTTPPLDVTTKYYVGGSGYNQYCENLINNRKEIMITANPKPSVSNLPANPSVCGGGNVNFLPFASTVGGTNTYTWTCDRADIGLASTSGSGNIPTFTAAVNNTSSAIVATFTVTAKVTSTGCVGTPQTFTLTINPRPSVSNLPANPTICGGELVDFPSFTSNVHGTYSWSCNRTDIGLAPNSGTGNKIPQFTADNNTGAAIIATFTVTSTVAATACTGTQTFTLTINPKPSLTSPITPNSICSGGPFIYTAISSVSGTAFSWSRAAVAGISNVQGSGNGNIIGELLTNTTDASVIVAYAITMTANGCSNTQDVKVIVFGKLSAGSVVYEQEICPGETPKPFIEATPASGGTGNYTYRWQSSTDNATWGDINGATSTTYQPEALTTTTYYRRNVSESCGTVSSASIKVLVHPTLANYPDIRLQICPAPPRDLHLSSYLDTTYMQTVAWAKVTTGSPNITNPTGTINTGGMYSGTHIYTYSVANYCHAQPKTRKLYMQTITNKVIGLADTVVVCKEVAQSLNLNQIMGVDAGGTWSCDVGTDPVYGYVYPYVSLIAPPSAYAGLRILKGNEAYNGLQLTPHMKQYKGDNNAVYLEFEYFPDGLSCLAGKTKRLVIIVTTSFL